MRKCLSVFVFLTFALFFGAQPTVFAQTDDDNGATQQVKVYIPFMFVPGQPGSDQVDSEVAKSVVRIYLNDARQLHELAHELDLFEEPTTNGYAVAFASEAEVAALRAQGVRVESDAARTEELRSAQAEVFASSGQAINTIPGYACYRTVEETYSTFANLATTRPTLATWTDIGDSWEMITSGGKPGYNIYALQLTNSAKPGPKPKFLLMSAIHAREYATAELATRFVEDLVTKYINNDPDATWLLDNFELHVIPQANPDGRKMAEAGQLWRKNTDNNDGCRRSSSWGTDLNRNSSFKWNTGGSSSNACNETYRGPSAASEPETQAIENYVRSTFITDYRGPADTDAAPATAEGIFITLHSYGQLVLYPWGWTTLPAPNSTQLQTLGRKFGFFNGHQVCNGPACLYATSGTTDDMTYGERGIASYTFEVGTAFFQSCTTFTNDILPKNLAALHYAFKAARRPYQSPSGPDALSLTATPASGPAGTTITLNATLNDTRYNSNGWGTEPTQAIQTGRYTIDAPSWSAATSFSLTPTDGAFNTPIEGAIATINTTGWSAGRHTVFVEGQDANGNWGVPTAIFITIN